MIITHFPLFHQNYFIIFQSVNSEKFLEYLILLSNQNYDYNNDFSFLLLTSKLLLRQALMIDPSTQLTFLYRNYQYWIEDPIYGRIFIKKFQGEVFDSITYTYYLFLLLEIDNEIDIRNIGSEILKVSSDHFNSKLITAMCH